MQPLNNQFFKVDGTPINVPFQNGTDELGICIIEVGRRPLHKRKQLLKRFDKLTEYYLHVYSQMGRSPKIKRTLIHFDYEQHEKGVYNHISKRAIERLSNDNIGKIVRSIQGKHKKDEFLNMIYFRETDKFHKFILNNTNPQIRSAIGTLVEKIAQNDIKDHSEKGTYYFKNEPVPDLFNKGESRPEVDAWYFFYNNQQYWSLMNNLNGLSEIEVTINGDLKNVPKHVKHLQPSTKLYTFE